MTATTDILHRYVRGRKAMGDPELFLPGARRQEIFAAVARLVAGGTQDGWASADLERLGREGTEAEIRQLGNLEDVATVAGQCRRCSLYSTRTTVVFADGSPDARVLCIGEAPGANEDATGLPFVGRAGKLLDRLLLSAGFPRREVYICNVLKCRPPGNRNPLPEEIEACTPFLLRQVEFVAPDVIVAFGTFAAQTLLGTRDSLRRLRGRTHLYRGYPLVVTYHPAALLRNPGWTRPTWEDLQLVRRLVDGEGALSAREGIGTTHAPPDHGQPAPEQLTFGGPDG